MLVRVSTWLAAAGAFPTGPFLALACGVVVATFGHIIKSRFLILLGLILIAGVSIYVLYVVRPP
jgi:hypothetical protein